MALRIASGSFGQAATMRAKAGSIGQLRAKIWAKRSVARGTSVWQESPSPDLSVVASLYRKLQSIPGLMARN
jgi:hypothetical protein